MRCVQPAGERGSLRWIQHAVNERTEEFTAAVVDASGGRIGPEIEWRSPLKTDGFAEYRDAAFLELVGIDPSAVQLEEFWPRSGPQWDALGVTKAGEPVLVEAKANIREVITPPTGAGEVSRKLIADSLEKTKAALGVTSAYDWTGTFYQYANRLAHLYFLEEREKVSTWLVFVYFIGDADVEGPESVAEWKAALEVMYGAMGLGRRSRLLKRKIDVFLDVRRPGWLGPHVK